MSEYFIDQRGVVVTRAPKENGYGVRCAQCCYGVYVYQEQYNREGTPVENICSKYRPVESTCRANQFEGDIYKVIN